MIETALGELTVSVVGLGCNTFGRDIDGRTATTLVDAAIDAGMTFFDTADVYGEGRSEQLLSEALGSRHRNVVIASKFGNLVPGVPGSGGARPAYIRRALERSLRELRREWVDVYQLHRPDHTTPIAETTGALRELVDAGKIRAAGASNCTVDELCAFADAARACGLPLVTVQAEYSMVNREAETSGLTAACVRYGVGMLPYRPVAKGLLSGRMRRGDEPVRQLAKPRFHRFITEGNFRLVDRVTDFAAEHQRHPVQVALAWLLNRPSVACVFPGATRPEQVRINAAVGDWHVNADEAAALDALVDDPLPPPVS